MQYCLWSATPIVMLNCELYLLEYQSMWSEIVRVQPSKSPGWTFGQPPSLIEEVNIEIVVIFNFQLFP